MKKEFLVKVNGEVVVCDSNFKLVSACYVGCYSNAKDGSIVELVMRSYNPIGQSVLTGEVEYEHVYTDIDTTRK